MNARFCECFETLINVFTINDDLYSFLAFDINGLEHLLKKIDFKQKNINQEENQATVKIPEEEFLLSEGLITSINKDAPSDSNEKVSSVLELKEEEFANKIELMKTYNEHNLVCNHVDWTSYKKGNKTKILYMPLIGTTYTEYPLHLSIAKVI